MPNHSARDSRIDGASTQVRRAALVLLGATALALAGCQIKDAAFFDPIIGKRDVDPPTITRLIPNDAAMMSGLAIVTPQIQFFVRDTLRSNGAPPSGVASVKIMMDQQDLATTNDTNGVYSASIPSGVNGPKVFRLVATDFAGNTRRDSSSFVVWNQRPAGTIGVSADTQATTDFVRPLAIAGSVTGTRLAKISLDILKPGPGGTCSTVGAPWATGTDSAQVSSSSLVVPLTLAPAFSTNVLAFSGRAPGSSGTGTATYCVWEQVTDSTVDGTGKPTPAITQTATAQVIWQGADKGFADGFTRNRPGVVLILSNGMRTTSNATTGYYTWLNLPPGLYTMQTGANSNCANGNNTQFRVNAGGSTHTDVTC